MKLTQEMRDLLAQASVIAEGPAMNWGSRTSHGKAGAVLLTRQGPSLHEAMFDRFQGCRTQADRRRAVEWAMFELRRARRTPQPARGMAEPGSTAWKREIASEANKEPGDGQKAADHIGRLAKRYSISRASVYRYRAMYSEREAA